MNLGRDDYPEIRDAVRDLCAKFDSAYWQGIDEKRAYPEVPPRVEYRLTRFGERFTALMDGVEALQRELDGPRRRPNPS